ncbi:hypothetical protein [Paracoccus beibuensis]|uniref:hypothetical protein n=1 Tax=Paracoccus beibuensis TaxID=547602 RepID=UPI00224090E0|nr:hypothetical protein [Paracoccus beibuensis]
MWTNLPTPSAVTYARPISRSWDLVPWRYDPLSSITALVAPSRTRQIILRLSDWVKLQPACSVSAQAGQCRRYQDLDKIDSLEC